MIVPEIDILPLEPGDRLDAAEFERRYDATPNLKKAELVEGVVYMPSPVRLDRHAEPHIHMRAWIGCYQAATTHVRVADNATIRLDEFNMPQPDGLLMIESAHGGQATLGIDGYVVGAPEWIGEVSSSTASFDLHTKLDVYRRFNVSEYFVWRVLDRAVDWFAFAGGAQRRLAADPEGVIRSEVFPGLWLNAAALLDGNLSAVLATLNVGLASAEHAAFVKHLATPKT